MTNDEQNKILEGSKTKIAKKIEQYRYFAVFVTTTDIEFECIYKLFNWKQLYLGDTGYYYYEASIKRGNKSLKILMTRQNTMGMIAATRTAANIIWQFTPQYVVMTGVCAGIKNKKDDDLVLGDVVIADKIWNCSAGKYVKSEQAPIQLGNVGFVPRPQAIKIPYDTVLALKKAISSDSCTYPAHIGTVTSSMTVIANIEIIENQIKAQSKSTIALDMEGYGIAYACHIESAFRPTPIIVKGICDFANSEKCYDYQRFAANNSSKLTKLLLEKYLPVHKHI